MIRSDAPRQSGGGKCEKRGRSVGTLPKRRNIGQRPFADHHRKSCACALARDVAGERGSTAEREREVVGEVHRKNPTCHGQMGIWG